MLILIAVLVVRIAQARKRPVSKRKKSYRGKPNK
jgi:hypothetical protein